MRLYLMWTDKSRKEEKNASHAFLCQALLDSFGISVSEKDFERNRYGKPYLRNKDAMFFNLSHTNGLFAAVTDTEEVGIDCEKIRTLPSGQPSAQKAETPPGEKLRTASGAERCFAASSASNERYGHAKLETGLTFAIQTPAEQEKADALFSAPYDLSEKTSVSSACGKELRDGASTKISGQKHISADAQRNTNAFIETEASGCRLQPDGSSRPARTPLETYAALAKRFFHPKEYEYLCENHFSSEIFYLIWTKKESYIKYRGEGFHIPLKSFLTKPGYGVSLCQCPQDPDNLTSQAYQKSFQENGFVITVTKKSRNFAKKQDFITIN